MTFESSNDPRPEARDEPPALSVPRSRILQQFCNALAAEYRANVMIVGSSLGGFDVLGSAPQRWALQPLDVVALEIVFSSNSPSGLGSRRGAASDWLFVPVTPRSTERMALAVASRHCRRRFDIKLVNEWKMRLERILDENAVELNEEKGSEAGSYEPVNNDLPSQ